MKIFLQYCIFYLGTKGHSFNITLEVKCQEENFGFVVFFPNFNISCKPIWIFIVLSFISIYNSFKTIFFSKNIQSQPFC